MKVLIIGNGIAGITAARHIRKMCDWDITVISGESEFFFSRTALMYVFMGSLRLKDTMPYEPDFWKKNRINLIQGWVKRVEPHSKKLILDGGIAFPYDKLLIASGSKPEFFNWPGQELQGVQGFYSLEDLEKFEQHSQNCRQATVVGGGLIGVEVAEMLASRGIEVTFLVREDRFFQNVLPKEESELVGKHLQKHGIELRLKDELNRILPDEKGKVRAVVTEQGEEIPCSLVGIATGVKPNIAFLEGSGIETDRGVLADDFLQTNLPDVFAAGDCVQLKKPPSGRKAIEPIWYTGKIQGETVAKNICGQKTPYQPGIWFNSARFFNLEYQVYGFVPNTENSNTESLLWTDAAEEKLVRIVFEKKRFSVVGINLLGVRMRHELCDFWITGKASLTEVVSNLRAALFDPEFSSSPAAQIQKLYNDRFPNNPIVSSVKGNSLSLFQKLTGK